MADKRKLSDDKQKKNPSSPQRSSIQKTGSSAILRKPQVQDGANKNNSDKVIKTIPPRSEQSTAEYSKMLQREDTHSDIGFKPRKHQSRYPKSIIDDRVKVRVYHEPVHDDQDSEGGSGSELVVSSHHDMSKTHRALSLMSDITLSTTSTSSSSSASNKSNASLGSSIHKFRDDFDELKCKMRIFGESLTLCKCIAGDFKGKLTFMERRLTGLEKRQKVAKTESNYSAIIQKNKKLSTKTKEYVQKLQKCGTEEEMREVAARICKNYLHGFWKVVEPSEIKFRRISGGLSNYIYVVGLPDDTAPLYARLEKNNSDDDNKSTRSGVEVGEEPKSVLIRIYGQVHGERAMDAIVTESVIFTLLSERRLGPKLYGVFSGGRIEEFILSRPLYTRELRDPALSMKIAEKTAAVHSMDIPLSKEPTFIWKTMAKWLKTVKEECFNNGLKGKNEVEQKAIAHLREINYDAEIDWLRKFLATVDSPVVFCHNDLQEGNILLLDDLPPQTEQTDDFEDTQAYADTFDVEGSKSSKENNHTCKEPVTKEGSCSSIQNQSAPCIEPKTMDSQTSKAAFANPHTSRATFMDDINEDCNTSDTMISHISDSGEPRIYFIDFEYCAYNFRAFDIANHFQEWAYDYTNPEHPFYFENPENWPTLEQKEIFIKEYLKHYQWNQGESKDTLPNIDAINKLLVEVEAFTLASHLFWVLWSIVNANKSQIPFGYWEYGHSRLETYLRLKQEVIKKEKYGLPQKRKIEEVDI